MGGTGACQAGANVQGLISSVNARADGTIGVSYFDMHSNTVDPATLLIDYWLATSRDGVNWTDRRITAAFDLVSAPIARGYFLGDYMGLTSAGSNFFPLYVRTNSGNLTNRNDVFVTPVNVPTGTTGASIAVRVAEFSAPIVSAQFQQRVQENIVRKLEQRVPGWARMAGCAKTVHRHCKQKSKNLQPTALERRLRQNRPERHASAGV